MMQGALQSLATCSHLLLGAALRPTCVRNKVNQPNSHMSSYFHAQAGLFTPCLDDLGFLHNLWWVNHHLF